MTKKGYYFTHAPKGINPFDLNNPMASPPAATLTVFVHRSTNTQKETLHSERRVKGEMRQVMEWKKREKSYNLLLHMVRGVSELRMSVCVCALARV